MRWRIATRPARAFSSARTFPGPEDSEHFLTFNSAGTRLAVGCDAADYALVFDPRSGREVARLPDLPHLTSMSFLSADVLLTVMIMGGLVTAWIGPDVGGEREDGTSGPVPEGQRFWIRAFGVACVVGGVVLLVITALGLQGPGAEGPPTP